MKIEIFFNIKKSLVYCFIVYQIRLIVEENDLLFGCLRG